MATRFYLPAYHEKHVIPGISPAFDTNWNVTNGHDQPTWVRRPLFTSTIKYFYAGGLYQPQTSQDTEPVREGATAAVLDVLVAQFISPPLETPGTIGTGTVKGQIYTTQNTLAADMRAQMSIRVVSRDGTTVRGTLLGFDTGANDASEFTQYGIFTNRKFPRGGAQNLSSLACNDGDRIIIEVGYRGHEGTSSNRDARFRFTADGSSGDLPEDETTQTNTYSTWMEFSENFSFETDIETRLTGIWTEVALSGATYTPRVTAIWVEVATEEFWHGFGTPEVGEQVDTADLGIGPYEPGFIISGAAASRVRGRSKVIASPFTPTNGQAYRSNHQYRQSKNYRA